MNRQRPEVRGRVAQLGVITGVEGGHRTRGQLLTVRWDNHDTTYHRNDPHLLNLADLCIKEATAREQRRRYLNGDEHDLDAAATRLDQLADLLMTSDLDVYTTLPAALRDLAVLIRDPEPGHHAAVLTAARALLGHPIEQDVPADAAH